MLLRHHHAAFKLGAALDVIHDGIELVEVERLCTVAEGVCGIVMRLDDQAVSTGSDGCAGQRLHHITAACCMGRVDDDRQVAEHLNQRNSGDIQIIADQLLKGTDAALAQDNIGIAACENVLGSHEELLHGGGQTALEEDRLFRAAQLLKQHEVLHVAGAKLDDIYICEQVEVLFAHDLGDDRQTGLTLCLEQQLETLGLQTLDLP